MNALHGPPFPSCTGVSGGRGSHPVPDSVPDPVLTQSHLLPDSQSSALSDAGSCFHSDRGIQEGHCSKQDGTGREPGRRLFRQ